MRCIHGYISIATAAQIITLSPHIDYALPSKSIAMAKSVEDIADAKQAVAERVKECEFLLGKLAECYHTPFEMRVYTNAVVQSLRNVTFIAQSHKSCIPQFDGWYLPWQSFFKDDPTLVRLVQARNVIVKQRDLESSSVATIEVLSSYEADPIWSDAVSPTMSSEEIIRHASQQTLVSANDARFVRVTRRWETAEFGQHDLYDQLLRCYTALSAFVTDLCEPLKLIADAVENLERITQLVAGEDISKSHLLPKDESFRSLTYDFKRSDAVGIASYEFSTVGKSASERFDDIPSDTGSKDFQSLGEVARSLLTLASVICKEDGWHAPHLFTGKYGEPPQPQLILQVDKSERFAVMHLLAEKIDGESDADFAFFVSSAHQSRESRENLNIPASEAGDRERVLVVAGISHCGEKTLLLRNIFGDDQHGYKLGDVRIEPDADINIMEPISRVLGPS